MSLPDLSVVIPFVNSPGDLRDCLAALGKQGAVRLEILVVSRLGEIDYLPAPGDTASVTVLQTPLETPIPQMRALAFRKAKAPAIAVIEDHVIVPPNWSRQMLDALAAGEDVVGGSIENAATGTLIDWASFLCEYSATLPPLPTGPSTWLPGNNVIYRRELLERFRPVIEEGKWENHLHDAMRTEGITLMMRPDIVVGHKMHYTFWLYFLQRYLYARSFAAGRVKGTPGHKRILMGFAAFLLPPVLFYRTVQRVYSKRRHLDHLVKSLPLLSIFVVSWAFGEVMGYWFGDGNSLSKVR